jgi:hypothetical protein
MNTIRVRALNRYWFPRLFYWSAAVLTAWWWGSGFDWSAGIALVGVPVGLAVVSELVDGLCDAVDRERGVR